MGAIEKRERRKYNGQASVLEICSFRNGCMCINDYTYKIG
jgi:hypothetical protein